MTLPSVRLAAFGDLLRQFRTARHWSQSHLAELADIDNTSVSRLESGARLPSREMVERLADALQLAAVDRWALFLAAGMVEADDGWIERQAEIRVLRQMIARLTAEADALERRAG